VIERVTITKEARWFRLRLALRPHRGRSSWRSRRSCRSERLCGDTPEGISIGYFAVLLIGFGLWVSYGIASHDLPLVVPNCVAFLVMGCTIAVALDKR
jgi:hypothetical protein